MKVRYVQQLNRYAVLSLEIPFQIIGSSFAHVDI